MLLTKDYKYFELELLMLRAAYKEALIELEEARPNISEEMFRFAKDSLIAAFKLEKAKLVAFDEEKVQCAEKLYYKMQDKVDFLFKTAGFDIFYEESEEEDIAVIKPVDKSIFDFDKPILIPDESMFMSMEDDEDAENE